MGDRRRHPVPAAVAPGDDAVRSARDLLDDGAAWITAEHPHALHLERTLYWARAIDPSASGPLLLAALLHDIERATPDPESPFDSARDWSSDTYIDYHQGRSANHLARWMADRDAAPAEIAASVGLVAVHERGGWREADTLQAADSLSFIETMTPLLLDWIASGRSTREGALAKLDGMWDRISVPAARELGRELHASAREACS
jgi:hypothetical protein